MTEQVRANDVLFSVEIAGNGEESEAFNDAVAAFAAELR